ncbi:MAG: fasciclin domain-containing protein [Catalinimonas sp.]
MNKRIFSFVLSAALITGTAVSAQTLASADNQTPVTTTKEPTKTIAINVMDNQELGYFERALQRTNLDRILDRKGGSFTVFAPTNDAFEKIPNQYYHRLWQNHNGALTQLLKYHIVKGQINAADLKDGQMLKTLQGSELRVSRKGNQVYINGAPLTATDITSRNGVIHTVSNIAMIP